MLRDRYSTDVKNRTIFDDAQCSPDFFVIIIRVGAHHDDVLLLQLDLLLQYWIIIHNIIVETLRLFDTMSTVKKFGLLRNQPFWRQHPCDSLVSLNSSITITYKKKKEVQSVKAALAATTSNDSLVLILRTRRALKRKNHTSKAATQPVD